MKFGVLWLYCVISSLMAFAQTTIHVPGDSPTIQGAIDATSNGDTVLVAPGTYTENLDFKGKSITVTSGATSSSDAASTILRPAAFAPTVVFKTNEPATAVLNGFTIEGGNSVAVYMPQASATITNNVITQNTGCALVVSGNTSSPLIQGNTMSETNDSVECSGTAEVGILGWPRPGSGIFVLGAGDVRLIGNLVENNVAVCGAVAIRTAASVVLRNNTIRNNHSVCPSGLWAMDVTDISLVQNLIYKNSSFEDAASRGQGGGISIGIDIHHEGAASLTMIGNTVYGNHGYSNGTPTSDYGEQAYVGGSYTSVDIENNLFIGDDEYLAFACHGGLSANSVIAYNDVFNPGTLISNTCSGSGVRNNLGVDPLFVNTSINDFHTGSSSPVVAAGDINAPQIPSQDLDGKARTVCGTIDMGVYEVHPHPSITLQSSANPVSGGSSVTFDTTVNGNCNVPTGSVTFLDGANTLGTGVLNGSGRATFTTSSLTVGTHPITVTYPGDTNFSDGTSTTLSQVVTGYPSQTSLVVSPVSGKAFQVLTLNTTVLSEFGSPTGTVSFSANGRTVATASLSASGVATTSVNTLGAGTYEIIASYNASSQFAGSASPPATVVLTGADTITTLALSPASIAPGQTVTLTGQVSAKDGQSTPTGVVTFVAGTTTLGTAKVGANGVATLSLSSLTTGSYPVRAVYGGDANFNTSTSGVANLLVTAIPTSLGLNVSPNPAPVGQKVTFVATAVAGSANQPPTGSVTFSDETGVLGSGTLVSGVASLSLSTLSVGTHQIFASLSPTGPYAGSVSATVTETITNASFVLKVNPTSLTIPSGDYEYVEVTVTPTGGFTHAVDLACSPMPAHAECSFASTQTQPLGNGTQTVRLMVNTSDVLGYGHQVSSADAGPRRIHNGISVLAASFLFPVLVRLRKKLNSRSRGGLLVVGLTAFAWAQFLAGCSGKLPGSTAPGNYAITITATESGSVAPVTQEVPLSIKVTER